MTRNKITGFIAIVVPAAACPSAKPKMSAEHARDIALSQRIYREWRASQPPPEAYNSLQDRQRARLLEKPCTRADLNHGCYLSSAGSGNQALQRDIPCVIHKLDYDTSRSTDQCYRLTAPQHFRGIWIDAFEGSRFYPGLRQRPAEERIDYKAADARAQMQRMQRNSIWLDVDSAHVPRGFEHGRSNGRAVLVDFIGRKTLYPGHYGHLGMSGNEIIVDKMNFARELK